ncbi:MAG: hypothetical protein HN633_04785 [Candidatus Marinimicrobia bacterium]|nr:hypothetical protein [Candidatus Neomarinimicrobiota bacterium]
MKLINDIKPWFMKLSLLTFLIIGMLSCTEDLSIADFADDFESYEQELRIEGILNLTDFSKSVIRVDKTILITDTSLYNGIDDNGDWVSYSDLNGNGVWDEDEPLNDDIGIKQPGPSGGYEGRGNGIADPGEPHIDDYLEILPQIHDASLLAVVLRETLSQIPIAEFEWSDSAAYFDEGFGAHGPPSEIAEATFIRYYYGGYIPTPESDEVELVVGKEYTIELTTTDGKTISASTTPIAPPLNLEWPETTVDIDTFIVSIDNYASLSWNTPIETNFCGVIMDEVFPGDSLRGFYSSMAVAINIDDTGLPVFPANFVGIPLGLYKLSLESYSYEYGNYVYSGLPLRDRALSNWRDQDGNVVLGAFGAKSPIEFYVRFTAAEDSLNG